MGTFRQKKLAKALIDNAISNDPMNKGELLEKVGYAKNTAEAKPGEILEQKGVQEELKAYGFDEDSAKRVVKEVMSEKEEPNARLKAADMVFKVHGSYAPEKKDITSGGEKINLAESKLEQINEIALND